MNPKIFKKLLSRVKGGARKTVIHSTESYSRGRKIEIPVYITVEDLVNQFNKQKGLCYWFGKPFEERPNSIAYHPLAISVDRIGVDPAIGYTKDNIVLCYRIANLGRCKYDSKAFKEIVDFLRKIE